MWGKASCASVSAHGVAADAGGGVHGGGVETRRLEVHLRKSTHVRPDQITREGI